jgi:hypothetical protein
MYENQLDFIKQNTSKDNKDIYENEIHNFQHNSYTNNSYYNQNINNNQQLYDQDYNYNNIENFNQNNYQYNQNLNSNNFNNYDYNNNNSYLQNSLHQNYLHNNRGNEGYFLKGDENIYFKHNQINNETYARNQQLQMQMDLPEQLDYMNQYDINIFPEARPTALIYNNMKENNDINKKKNTINKLNKKKKGAGVGAAWEYNKNFLKNLKIKMNKNTNKKKFIGACTDKNCKPSKYEEIRVNKNPAFYLNLQNQNQNQNHENINNLKNKGLFDPNLKSKELDFPRKTQIERMARLEKIKNYDVKFGSQVRKLEVYKNIADMFDDMTFEKEEKEYRKKAKKIGKKFLGSQKNENKEKNFNELTYNIDTDKENNEKFQQKFNYYKTKYVNNLDFNFAHHEQMIKALEDQITLERKMRIDTNMKYFKKMKEVEENKLKAFITATTKKLSRSVERRNNSKGNFRNKNKGNNKSFTPVTNKPKRLMKTYLNKENLYSDSDSYSKSYCDSMALANASKEKDRDKDNKNKNTFKNNLEKSMDLIKVQNKIVDTRSTKAKNNELVKNAMKDIRPHIDKIVENDFKKIINKVLDKDIKNDKYDNDNDNDSDNDYYEEESKYNNKKEKGTFDKMRNYSAGGKLNQIKKSANKYKSNKKIDTLKKVYNSSRSNSQGKSNSNTNSKNHSQRKSKSKDKDKDKEGSFDYYSNSNQDLSSNRKKNINNNNNIYKYNYNNNLQLNSSKKIKISI